MCICVCLVYGVLIQNLTHLKSALLPDISLLPQYRAFTMMWIDRFRCEKVLAWAAPDFSLLQIPFFLFPCRVWQQQVVGVRLPFRR